MMNYDQDLELYIPEGQTISPFRGLPTPPTEPIHSPPTHKTLTQLDDGLPQQTLLNGVGGMTQKTSTPLDSVGGKQPAIGPKRRQRRGAAPRTPQQQARSVARRNARERKRVKLVNLGFATLRDHIPPHLGISTAPAPTKSSSNNNKTSNSNNKKLSKVETLRCAIEYIRQLREAIGYDDNDNMDFQSFDLLKDSSVEVSSPAETSSSFASNSSSPVPMLESPSLFDDDDENDDFFNIVDWTTL
ncbi:hypothetical protein JTE90_014438 [Oedothorax gibbosus]|uniref:BHLH domain-containing protein n=1 Tax=Oedothorax gibbosus TaxID=931172 RepID=A0AAV6V0S3_9ARAC|nr:hypothetical protein JTE90_014438 [Oedothorax gibbosus]